MNSLKLYPLITVILLGIGCMEAQQKNVSQIETHCQTHLPRLWKDIEMIKNDNVKIVYNDQIRGPGAARGATQIALNPRFILNEVKNFPEDRLIVVLLHEYGHILHNREQTDPAQISRGDHEYAAFRYSVEETYKRAIDNDSGPLRQVVKNLQLRAEKGRPEDAHTQGIEKLMKDDIWHKAVAWVEEN